MSGQELLLEIIVKYDGNPDGDLVKNIKCERFLNGDVNLHSILNELLKYGYPLDGQLILYETHEDQEYVPCGEYPNTLSTIVPNEEASTGRVVIKFTNEKSMKDFHASQSALSRKRGPTKERKIGFILEKVTQWRRLFNGTFIEEGETVEYSLEEAAKKVGISKKSLEDYYTQIKLGKKYGFDFKKHTNDKVRVLRSFVKKQKAFFENAQRNLPQLKKKLSSLDENMAKNDNLALYRTNSTELKNNLVSIFQDATSTMELIQPAKVKVEPDTDAKVATTSPTSAATTTTINAATATHLVKPKPVLAQTQQQVQQVPMEQAIAYMNNLYLQQAAAMTQAYQVMQQQQQVQLPNHSYNNSGFVPVMQVPQVYYPQVNAAWNQKM